MSLGQRRSARLPMQAGGRGRLLVVFREYHMHGRLKVEPDAPRFYELHHLEEFRRHARPSLSARETSLRIVERMTISPAF